MVMRESSSLLLIMMTMLASHLQSCQLHKMSGIRMRIVIKSWLDILYRLLNSCRYECNFYVNHLIFSGLGLHILCKSLFNELQQNQDQNDTYTRRKIRSGLIFTASINSKTRGDHLYSTIKGPSSFFQKFTVGDEKDARVSSSSALNFCRKRVQLFFIMFWRN